MCYLSAVIKLPGVSEKGGGKEYDTRVEVNK